MTQLPSRPHTDTTPPRSLPYKPRSTLLQAYLTLHQPYPRPTLPNFDPLRGLPYPTDPVRDLPNPYRSFMCSSFSHPPYQRPSCPHPPYLNPSTAHQPTPRVPKPASLLFVQVIGRGRGIKGEGKRQEDRKRRPTLHIRLCCKAAITIIFAYILTLKKNKRTLFHTALLISNNPSLIRVRMSIQCFQEFSKLYSINNRTVSYHLDSISSRH